MFDNVTKPPSGAVPSNLPMGEPDDMFAGQDFAAASSVPETPVDLNAAPAQPTALDAGVLRPRVQSEQPATMPPERPTQTEPMAEPHNVSFAEQASPIARPNASVLRDPLGGRTVLITIGTLLGLGVVGGIGAWVYFSYINPKPTDSLLPVVNQVVAPTSTVVIPTVVTTTTTTSTIPVETSTTTTDSQILFGEPVLDTDSDGLDDAYEKKIGTNMLLWDTDSDTLSDGDEVLTWKTNPLKADTDGDGFNDGAEIRNGYNPNGTGKLFPTPSSTTPVVTATSTK